MMPLAKTNMAPYQIGLLKRSESQPPFFTGRASLFQGKYWSMMVY